MKTTITHFRKEEDGKIRRQRKQNRKKKEKKKEDMVQLEIRGCRYLGTGLMTFARATYRLLRLQSRLPVFTVISCPSACHSCPPKTETQVLSHSCLLVLQLPTTNVAMAKYQIEYSLKCIFTILTNIPPGIALLQVVTIYQLC